jgi:hypothetical protein
LTAALVIGGAGHAFAQECPRSDPAGPGTPSRVRTLEGRLVFHDDIRGYFELKLDRPQCGEGSVQLTADKYASLEVFRGCRVSSTGIIDFSPTGYYSLEEFQFVTRIEPAGACSRQAPFPDYSRAKPAPSVRAYRVDMHVDYRPGDHPVEFRITSAGRELRPWQAYASYDLTGGMVLYGHCADGFVIDDVFGTAQARPSHFDEPGTPADMAAFDPENAADAGKRDLRLGYTCVRQPHGERRKK